MSTDRTAFDEWLKKRLYRDIIFRGLVWACISSIAMSLAIQQANLSTIEYFTRTAATLSPVINVVGSVSIVIALIALMFKDLEQADRPRFDQTTSFGQIGGVFRRIAGDLTLWTVGALVTVLFAAVVAITRLLHANEISMREATSQIPVLFFILMMVAVLAALNIVTRREAPFITSYNWVPARAKRPVYLIAIYTVMTALLVVWLVVS